MNLEGKGERKERRKSCSLHIWFDIKKKDWLLFFKVKVTVEASTTKI